MGYGRPMRALKASLATSLGEMRTEKARIACMRKLLTTFNAMFRHRTRWRTECLSMLDSQDSC
jgi:hypothetical protein